MKKIVIILTLIVLIFNNSIFSANKIKLVWIPHNACEKLIEISKEYTKLTGIEIEVLLVPYGPQWHHKIASELASQGDGFDLAVWDSQSVAEFAGNGDIELLNSYVENSKKLSFKDFDPHSIKRYGEFPENSGNIWAIPINQDALGLMYRKDLFEDPVEKKKFKKIYGYDLDVPKTYKELEDIAKFFTRPKKGLYGWGQFASIDYDLATSSSNCFLWSYGGKLWNHKSKEVLGYLNSKESVRGLEQYLKMFNYSPPGSRVWGYLDVNNYFQQGKLAMAMQWYVLFEKNEDPKNIKFYEKVGYANLPGAYGLDGKFRRKISMGGQGIGINKYSKNKKEAWKFIEWFQQKEQQWKYTTVGQTARVDILKDKRYQKLNSWNKYFAEVMQYTDDYWHLPEYIQLLEILQEEVVSAIAGRKSAKEALTDAAKRHEKLLKKAGYRIRRKKK